MIKKIRKVRKQSKDASSPLKEKRTRQLDQIRRDILGDVNTSQQAQLSGELKKNFCIPQKRQSVLTLVSSQKPNLTVKKDYISKTLLG